MNILDVREMQLETSYCILTSIAPLRKDNLAQDNFLANQSSFHKEKSLCTVRQTSKGTYQ